jgi:hypothetical protein
VLEISTKGRNTFQKVLALREEFEERIVTLGKQAPNARAVSNILYRRTYISAKDIEAELGRLSADRQQDYSSLCKTWFFEGSHGAAAISLVRVRSLP